MNKFDRKLSRWKGAFVSMIGKIQLVKVILQSIPVYMVSVFPIPALVDQRINHIYARFI